MVAEHEDRDRDADRSATAGHERSERQAARMRHILARRARELEPPRRAEPL